MGFWIFMFIINLLIPVVMVALMVPIIPTERALARQFDKDGNKK